MTPIIDSIKKNFSSLKKSKEESLKEYFVDHLDRDNSEFREWLEKYNIYSSFLKKDKEESIKGYFVDHLESKPQREQDSIKNDVTHWHNESCKDKSKYQKKLFSQIICFRWCAFIFMILMMSGETIALFLIVFYSSTVDQSSNSRILEINPTTLQVLTASTIIQISAMVIVMVRSVFPRKLDDLILEEIKMSI
jgi:hypothetical protein